LPALSVTVTWPVTPSPSALITSGLVALFEAMPLVASATVNGAFTFVLFHPFAFVAGENEPQASVGGVASRLIVTDLLVVPAPDVTLQLNVVPVVSVVTVVFTQPVCDRMFCGAFTICHATCTSLVYQPLLPGVPVTV